MTKTNATYALERGTKSPRDGAVMWQLYDHFGSLPEAKTEAGRVGPSHPKASYWRVVRSETVWLKEPE